MNEFTEGMDIRNLVSDLVDNLDRLNGSKAEAIDYSINMLQKLKKEVVNESPVYNVIKVHTDLIRANSYNPNAVAPPEMKLLELSIWEDGFTMPVVCYYLKDENVYEIVDGYHRYTTLLTSERIREREKSMLPVVVIEKDLSNRMASTIRHNRARGSHSIDLMSNIVAELVESGMSDGWILRHIGMDKDELLRLKQITGLAALFSNQEFSRAWDEKDQRYETLGDTVD
jgi:ParB-like chromosome segregation protein Spo0J